MDTDLDAICNSLDNISKAVLGGWNDDRTMNEVWGWNFPAVTRHDLALVPENLAKKLRETSVREISDALRARLSRIPAQLASLQNLTLPQLFNGNGAAATPSYLMTFEAISQTIEPLVSWERVDPKNLPQTVARRIRAINAELEQLAPDMESLKQQIGTIKSASEAADALPVDLQELSAAKQKVSKAMTESEILYRKIVDREKESEDHLTEINSRSEEATKLVENCESAYRITTTKGLSASFQERANKLSLSVWLWVGLLILTLGAGAFLGYHRIEVITTALNDKDPKVGVIWLHVALSALSVGAPLWFAWLATKQIGQRFKLAEDYAFKASVAKAYEGYRKEAARLDEKLETQLFSSALKRLDEEPLRLVDKADHSSPWSEMLASKAVSKALEAFPQSKNQIFEIARQAVTAFRGDGKNPVTSESEN